MGISNKLGVFCIGVNLLVPTMAQALIIEPIKIDSSQGEPLYAEIRFHQANNQNPLQVSIAQPFELGVPEAVDPQKFAHYNFYVRQNNQGNGVIVITSNRPINDNNLNLALKINDSGQVHIKQLRHKLPSRIERLESSLKETPLQPRIVVDEKALALNLPTTSDHSSSAQTLVVSKAPPPMLNKSAGASTASQNTKTSAPLTTQNQPVPTLQIKASEPTSTPSSVVQSSTASLSAETPQHNQQHQVGLQHQLATQATEIPAATISVENPSEVVQEIEQTPSSPLPPPKPSVLTSTASRSEQNQHKVKANESLWAIAHQISKSQNVSIHHVMSEIHKNNSHAFINGQANRLKQGAILNIPTEYQVPVTAKTTIPKKIAPTQPTKTLADQTPAKTAKQSKAHMSIVANNSKGAAQGANKAGQAHSTKQNELTVRLKQERQSALALQNNVRQLDQQLKQKEKRIALLNARLAELEQQLKLRQTEQKSKDTSKTSSRSQSIVPANNHAGTLVAFAGLNSDFAIATLL